MGGGIGDLDSYCTLGLEQVGYSCNCMQVLNGFFFESQTVLGSCSKHVKTAAT